MSPRRSIVLMWVLALGVPSLAYAQASITGVVRDTSGAVLPGVVVEASSPALIERTRSATTDGSGQYRLVDLRPGAYTVKFTLPGFNTVTREGLELTGTFTATLNAELRVGALEENVTVTGAAPVVDVQSATRQTVISAETFATVPSSRAWNTMAALIPGVSRSNTSGGAVGQDVGGASGEAAGMLTVHGSRYDEMALTLNGMNFTTHIMAGNTAVNVPSITSMQEVTVDIAASDASSPLGGPRVNMIPKEGGNRYSGTVFFTGAQEALQGNNLDDALRAQGITLVDRVKSLYDFNPGVGGPLKRDRVWFYGGFRRNLAQSFLANTYYNKNHNDPTQWAYVADLSRPFATKNSVTDGNLRLTWQATTKNKFQVAFDKQYRCQCGTSANSLNSPESVVWASFPTHYVSVDWSSPRTNRMLLEANMVFRKDEVDLSIKIDPPTDPRMIRVTELSTGVNYRAPVTGARSRSGTRPKGLYYRGSASYITGTHAFKAGFNASSGWGHDNSESPQSLQYFLFNGVPVQLVQFALPSNKAGKFNDLGLYAQDRWTRGRLTLTGGIRYDYAHSGWNEVVLGPGRFVPTRNLRIPAGTGVKFHDLTPRLAAAYDLFGTSRTAVKVSLNKYLQGLGWDQQTIAGATNPVNTLSLATPRAWADANRDYVPDCDLLNPAANGECGPIAVSSFGSLQPTSTFDPQMLSGWGSRAFNWEFSAGVQQQIVSGIAANVAYFRRWYGNFAATDNRAQSASDFDVFSITAPTHPKLPGGGGYAVTGLVNVRPDRFSVRPDNYQTFARNYGKQVEYWQGVDVGVDARLVGGLTAQGGLSTGRVVTDNCEVVEKLPEMLISGGTSTTAPGVTMLPRMFCRQVQPFLTQLKGSAAYTIPRLDVLVAATLQNTPGPAAPAQFVATNAVVAPGLGRPLSGGQTTLTTHIVNPLEVYGDRINQVDLRFSKLLRLGGTRTMFTMDLYNALNANSVLALSPSFAAWMKPTTILQARLVKFGAQFDF